MSDTKKKLIAAFEKLGIDHAGTSDCYYNRWSATDLATDLAPLLDVDNKKLYCPSCRCEGNSSLRRLTAAADGSGPAVWQVGCACGLTGPRRSLSDEAIGEWERIRIQGDFGTPHFNCGIEAIDNIHSIFEDCQRRGMKAEPIGIPGSENSMRRQIERFIRKVTSEKSS